MTERGHEQPEGRVDGFAAIVEIIDGQYKDSKERVSLQDFDAFLDSKPKAFTIDNLPVFAARRRGNN